MSATGARGAGLRTPEQRLPEAPLDGAWEQYPTTTVSWGQVAEDENWKPGRDPVVALVETAVAGGNLMINVGPSGHA